MKNFKRLGLLALNLILCIALVAGAVGLSKYTTYAADINVSTSKLFSTEQKIPDKADYGTSVTIPYITGGTTLINPMGHTVDSSSLNITGGTATFTAAYLGNYLVTYVNGTTKHTFKIAVTAEHDWVLEVAYDGADIPTVKKVGSEIKLPTAKAVVYDKNDADKVIKTNTDADVLVNVRVDVVDPTGTKVIDSKDGTSIASTEHELTLNLQGSYFIRYSYAVPATGASSYVITRDFEIKVQASFNDEEDPIISVPNPSQSANLNVAYTLPKATATDNFDENIKIVVTVTDPNGDDVVEVDYYDADDEEYGFATVVTEKPVEFDNNKTMKFVPTEKGTYTLTYQAFDDEGRSSVAVPYYIEVEDKLAPTIKVDAHQIPMQWATTIENKAKTPVNTDIIFPVPTVRDNTQTRDENGNLLPVKTVEFTIKKGDTQIIKFDNINDSEPKATITGTNTELEFLPTGLVFNFSMVTADTVDNKIGEYTVTYVARDENNNSRTESFTINFQEKLTDEIAPSVEIKDVPQYFVVDEDDYTTYTVPTPTLFENNATYARTNVEIFLVYGTNQLEVEAGDVLEFRKGLYINDADTAALSDAQLKISHVNLKVVATDHVGNSTPWTSANISIARKDLATSFTFTVSGDSSNAEQHKEVTVADQIDIDLTGTISLNFTGFELIITEPNSDVIVARTSMNVTYLTGGDKLFNSDGSAKETIAATRNLIRITDVKFTPSKSGVYTVTLKAFDFAGNTQVISYPVTVAPSDDFIITSSQAISTKVEHGVKYQLPRYSTSLDNIPITTTITGPHFRLMGTEFTALSGNGDYSIEFSAVSGNNTQQATPIKTSITVTESPVLKIVGTTPVYSPLFSAANPGNVVILPEVIAIDRMGVKMIPDVAGNDRPYEVSVKNRNGATVNVRSNEKKQLYFEPVDDGQYTIRYTAFNKTGGTSGFVEFTMYAGDITPPDFTVDAPRGSMNQNSFFKFNAITVRSAEDSNYKDLTFTKKIIFPDGSTPSIISNKGEDYMNMLTPSSLPDGYELTQAGTYTVIYEVTDKAGNTSTLEFKINVASTSPNTTLPIAVLSTVLVIVGILLLIGVGVYIWRFRPIKDVK